jgi:hypothetical protein
MCPKTITTAFFLLALVGQIFAADCRDAENNRIPCNTLQVTPLTLPSGSRVLFVGNSFTNYQGGVDTMVAGLAAADPGYDLIVDRRAESGWTWADHLNGGLSDSEGLLLADWLALGWDAVVLQDFSDRPITDLAGHKANANTLAGLVEASPGGSTGLAAPVFAMTWAYQDKDLVMTAPLSDAYTDDGLRNGANVSPLGLAWQRVIDERPDIELYDDYKHPTIAGQYLNACVHYAVLSGRDISGNGYIPLGLGLSEAYYLRETAAALVADYLVVPTSLEVRKSACITQMQEAGFDPLASGPTQPNFAKAYGHFIYLPPAYHGFRYQRFPLIVVSEGLGELGDGEDDLEVLYKHGLTKIIAGRDDRGHPAIRLQQPGSRTFRHLPRFPRHPLPHRYYQRAHDRPE